MAEDEREAFSERWFTDPALSEDLRNTEADLLDAYAQGKVSGQQRKQIERWLLGSSTQRRKLDFARALATLLPGQAPRRIPWAMLGAVAAGVVLLAGLSLLFVRNRQLESQLQARSQVQARPLPGSVYAILLP